VLAERPAVVIRDPRTYRIIGAAMAVHRTLGNGFLEAVYQEALAVRFELDGIPFKREVPFDIEFEGRQLPTRYRADFVCYDEVVNYLKVTDLEIGLLLNFGLPSLEHRRYIFSRKATTESTKLQRDVTLHVLPPQSHPTEGSA
jgi:hypothetical protein